MFSRNDGAGFFEIDHRESPGMTEADLAMMPDAIMVRGGNHLQRDVKQCNHCWRMVILHPGRVQERERCWHCDKFVCQYCYAMLVKNNECTPFVEVMLRAYDQAVKFLNQPDHPDAAPRIVLTDV